ncbi:hypothetical protein BgiBS90_008937 [Biomphalaria glabrata]|nr:hypothetical protein BgiBS90_008937 [Biomphalaria glabrata]
MKHRYLENQQNQRTPRRDPKMDHLIIEPETVANYDPYTKAKIRRQVADCLKEEIQKAKAFVDRETKRCRSYFNYTGKEIQLKNVDKRKINPMSSDYLDELDEVLRKKGTVEECRIFNQNSKQSQQKLKRRAKKNVSSCFKEEKQSKKCLSKKKTWTQLKVNTSREKVEPKCSSLDTKKNNFSLEFLQNDSERNLFGWNDKTSTALSSTSSPTSCLRQGQFFKTYFEKDQVNFLENLTNDFNLKKSKSFMKSLASIIQEKTKTLCDSSCLNIDPTHTCCWDHHRIRENKPFTTKTTNSAKNVAVDSQCLSQTNKNSERAKTSNYFNSERQEPLTYLSNHDAFQNSSFSMNGSVPQNEINEINLCYKYRPRYLNTSRQHLHSDTQIDLEDTPLCGFIKSSISKNELFAHKYKDEILPPLPSPAHTQDKSCYHYSNKTLNGDELVYHKSCFPVEPPLERPTSEMSHILSIINSRCNQNKYLTKSRSEWNPIHDNTMYGTKKSINRNKDSNFASSARPCPHKYDIEQCDKFSNSRCTYPLKVVSTDDQTLSTFNTLSPNPNNVASLNETISFNHSSFNSSPKSSFDLHEVNLTPRNTLWNVSDQHKCSSLHMIDLDNLSYSFETDDSPTSLTCKISQLNKRFQKSDKYEKDFTYDNRDNDLQKTTKEISVEEKFDIKPFLKHSELAPQDLKGDLLEKQQRDYTFYMKEKQVNRKLESNLRNTWYRDRTLQNATNKSDFSQQKDDLRSIDLCKDVNQHYELDRKCNIGSIYNRNFSELDNTSKYKLDTYRKFDQGDTGNREDNLLDTDHRKCNQGDTGNREDNLLDTDHKKCDQGDTGNREYNLLDTDHRKCDQGDSGNIEDNLLDTDHRKCDQGDTGNREDNLLDTHHRKCDQGDTGNREDNLLDTDHRKCDQGDTGNREDNLLDTHHRKCDQGDTGNREDNLLDTDHRKCDQGDTGNREDNLLDNDDRKCDQGDTGNREDNLLDTDHRKCDQGDTGNREGDIGNMEYGKRSLRDTDHTEGNVHDTDKNDINPQLDRKVFNAYTRNRESDIRNIDNKDDNRQYKMDWECYPQGTEDRKCKLQNKNDNDIQLQKSKFQVSFYQTNVTGKSPRNIGYNTVLSQQTNKLDVGDIDKSMRFTPNTKTIESYTEDINSSKRDEKIIQTKLITSENSLRKVLTAIKGNEFKKISKIEKRANYTNVNCLDKRCSPGKVSAKLLSTPITDIDKDSYKNILKSKLSVESLENVSHLTLHRSEQESDASMYKGFSKKCVGPRTLDEEIHTITLDCKNDSFLLNNKMILKSSSDNPMPLALTCLDHVAHKLLNEEKPDLGRALNFLETFSHVKPVIANTKYQQLLTSLSPSKVDMFDDDTSTWTTSSTIIRSNENVPCNENNKIPTAGSYCHALVDNERNEMNKKDKMTMIKDIKRKENNNNEYEKDFINNETSPTNKITIDSMTHNRIDKQSQILPTANNLNLSHDPLVVTKVETISDTKDDKDINLDQSNGAYYFETIEPSVDMSCTQFARKSLSLKTKQQCQDNVCRKHDITFTAYKINNKQKERSVKWRDINVHKDYIATESTEKHNIHFEPNKESFNLEKTRECEENIEQKVTKPLPKKCAFNKTRSSIPVVNQAKKFAKTSKEVLRQTSPAILHKIKMKTSLKAQSTLLGLPDCIVPCTRGVRVKTFHGQNVLSGLESKLRLQESKQLSFAITKNVNNHTKYSKTYLKPESSVCSKKYNIIKRLAESSRAVVSPFNTKKARTQAVPYEQWITKLSQSTKLNRMVETQDLVVIDLDDETLTRPPVTIKTYGSKSALPVNIETYEIKLSSPQFTVKTQRYPVHQSNQSSKMFSSVCLTGNQ